ncbi:hypothetical protein [Streptomyces sp. NPDC018045]|uniref:hypothetical protein n=1 Tax=Streptomyces sp. NPDC018045 TaxID=3365037 RepID=UPI0037A922AC
MLVIVGLCLALLVAGVIALGLVAGGGDEPTPPPQRPPTGEITTPAPAGPRADVRITTCTAPEPLRWPTAELLITNNSSKTSDYWIDVEFLDARGVRISEGSTVADNLAPKMTAEQAVTGSRETSSPVTCRIVEVTRHAS